MISKFFLGGAQKLEESLLPQTHVPIVPSLTHEAHGHLALLGSHCLVVSVILNKLAPSGVPNCVK